ncbi:MAG TPA: DUF2490 domain-containing protein, partial [Blastocatellia bacterium]|nr:DUF2490 domain-containing protein [Blastocatellia bacterium]
AMVLAGAREGDDVSRVIQERIGGGFTVRLGKYVTVSPAFAFIHQRPVGGISEVEKRPWLDGTFTLPVGKWVISNRSRIEHRAVNAGSVRRYRNRLAIEHPISIRGFGLRLFAAEEVFYTWKGRTDRTVVRFAGGAARRLGEHVSVDLYYLRQHDARVSGINNHLNVLGTSFKIRL